MSGSESLPESENDLSSSLSSRFELVDWAGVDLFAAGSDLVVVVGSFFKSVLIYFSVIPALPVRFTGVVDGRALYKNRN